MKVQSVILGAVGVVAALVLGSFLALWLEKNWPGEQYDERQKIARGKAYRFAFWVGMVCYLAMMVYLLWIVEHEAAVEPFLLIYLIITVQFLAFHVYSLITGSALPFAGKPYAPMVSYGLLAVMEFADFFTRDVKEVLPVLGTGASGWINLVAGMAFLLLAVMYLISWRIRERE